MKKKLGGKFWAALVIFGLVGQVAWVVENMYFNVFIYKMFNASAADISSMVSAESTRRAGISARSMRSSTVMGSSVRVRRIRI